VHDQTADRVELLVAEAGAEVLVEVLDSRQGVHRVLALALAPDRLVFLDVVFVGDVAHDLLDDVLDGDEPRDAAVFVDDDRHVIAADPELLEKDVDPLALGHENGRPQHLAHVEGPATLLAEITQQVLGQQDADHLVAVLADDREARVSRLDDHRQQLLGWVVTLEHDHLRAGHHDVAHLEIGDLEDALDHGQRVRVDQSARAGLAKLRDQLGAVARLAAAHQPPEPVRPAAFLAHPPSAS